MKDDEFWRIIDKGKRSEEPEEKLRALLSRLSADEIASFEARLSHAQGALFTCTGESYS